jgi:hypothetical protein
MEDVPENATEDSIWTHRRGTENMTEKILSIGTSESVTFTEYFQDDLTF